MGVGYGGRISPSGLAALGILMKYRLVDPQDKSQEKQSRKIIYAILTGRR